MESELLQTSCPRCGGMLSIYYRDACFQIRRDEKGIWRYSLLPTLQTRVSLGEGLTPITVVDGVLVKNERFNPTGSYADRASSIIASYVRSMGITELYVEYVRDFTRSLIYYLPGLRVYVEAKDIFSMDGEDAYLFASHGVEVGITTLPTLIRYLNPLTLEGLKTIIFEIYERKINIERVVAPTTTGVLALSLLKGLADLNEVGLEVSYEVVAAVPKGLNPYYLRNVSKVKIVEVSEVELFETFKKLIRRGFKIKPIAALSYHVAENLGRSIAVVTMGYRPPLRGKDSEVKRSIVEVLSGGEALTAYEIWRRKPLYTLRAVYKAIKAMEVRKEICGEVLMKGKRKVKVYRLCSY